MTDSISIFSEHIATPHGCFPFADITVADVRAAIHAGIEEENNEIEVIASNPEPPTFENTYVAFEKAGRLLDRATVYMHNRLSAETSEELEQLAQEVSALLSAHSADIVQNTRLFNRLHTVKATVQEGLDEEEQMLLNDIYDDFVRSGAALDNAGKRRFKEIRAAIDRLKLTFSQNCLKETNAFQLHLTAKEQLHGLSEHQIEQAAADARERGLKGWVITLQAPSYIPFMTYADDRELRRQLYLAYNTKCTHDNDQNNFDACTKLVNLRQELAHLLGYDSYADYVLRHRMAGDVETVYALLHRLLKAYKPQAEHEVEAVKALARELEGEDFDFRPWDFAYYSRLLKKRSYDLDADMLRPYFELSAVIGGVFGLAQRLYGLTFRENKNIPVYHPEVRAYEVFDSDGSFMAVLYADFHPRSTKQGGAWMTSYKEESDYTTRPHVSIVMNLTRPTADRPALLTHEELETFLHEFGHALHAILANTRFRSLSGTNVYWDFVELPSQFMENFATEREFLRTFAYHYKTGELIPDKLVDRLIRSRNFNVAYACIRQVAFGLLDMGYYTLKAPLTTAIRDFEHQAWAEAQLLPQVDAACMTVQFGHIMSGGYAAGYYSYKWAEVLDADAFSLFKERGIFDRETARSFRDSILAMGGTRPPMQLYRKFRGQEPTIVALLRRTGIGTDSHSEEQ